MNIGKTSNMLLISVIAIISVLLAGCANMYDFGSCSLDDKDCQQEFIYNFNSCQPSMMQFDKFTDLYDLSMTVKAKGETKDACKIDLIIDNIDLSKYDAAVRKEMAENPDLSLEIKENAAKAKEELEDLRNNKISCKIPLRDIQKITDIEQVNFYSRYCKGELIT